MKNSNWSKNNLFPTLISCLSTPHFHFVCVVEQMLTVQLLQSPLSLSLGAGDDADSCRSRRSWTSARLSSHHHRHCGYVRGVQNILWFLCHYWLLILYCWTYVNHYNQTLTLHSYHYSLSDIRWTTPFVNNILDHNIIMTKSKSFPDRRT